MRLPKSLKRDPAYLFVTVRKGEKVNNEVAVMLGFAPKPGSGQTTATAAANGAVPAPASSASDPSLAIGSARYALVVKGANAWVQNPADESKVVAEMARGKKVVIKAVSQRRQHLDRRIRPRRLRRGDEAHPGGVQVGEEIGRVL